MYFACEQERFGIAVNVSAFSRDMRPESNKDHGAFSRGELARVRSLNGFPPAPSRYFLEAGIANLST